MIFMFHILFTNHWKDMQLKSISLIFLNVCIVCTVYIFAPNLAPKWSSFITGKTDLK